MSSVVRLCIVRMIGRHDCLLNSWHVLNNCLNVLSDTLISLKMVISNMHFGYGKYWAILVTRSVGSLFIRG
jgi:hypothetical protein